MRLLLTEIKGFEYHAHAALTQRVFDLKAVLYQTANRKRSPRRRRLPT